MWFEVLDCILQFTRVPSGGFSTEVCACLIRDLSVGLKVYKVARSSIQVSDVHSQAVMTWTWCTPCWHHLSQHKNPQM